MTLFTKWIQTHRHNKPMRRDKLEFGDKQIHITIHKIDKQQGPTIPHWKLYSITCNNL